MVKDIRPFVFIKEAKGPTEFTFNTGGILILGSQYNGANIYSIGYNRVSVIYEDASQKWASDNSITVKGYNINVSRSLNVFFISTDQSI